MSEVQEENILLGGKIADKHKDFKDIARMDKDTGLAYLIISKKDELVKQPADKQVLMVLEMMGEINFMAGCTELTKLSAILGDTRQKHSFKGLKDELRTRESTNDTQP
jgi:hypothetical protein